MSAPQLFVTEGFATGRVVETLVVGTPCSTVEQLDHSDTLTARISWPTQSPLLPRTPLRLIGSDGVAREYSVNHIAVDASGQFADLECIAPWTELTFAGVIRQVVNGELSFSFGGRLTISQWLTTYFVPNLAADGLAWIDTTLGTIDVDALVSLSGSYWNRMQLVQELTDATGYEFSLEPTGAGGLYRITCQTTRGGTLPTLTVSRRFNALNQVASNEATDLVTYAQPAGDVPTGGVDPASIGENAWIATIVGTGWVSLTDPNGGRLAIRIDGQCVGRYLEVPSSLTSSYRQILASRASDGAVQIASTTGLSGGAVVVRIVADSSGTPVSDLPNPAGVALYRRVVKSIAIAGGRGERNWFPNPLADRSPMVWTAGSGGWVEAHAVTDTTDATGAANGGHAIGVTSLAVKGFPPYTVIRKGTFFQNPSNDSLFAASTVTLDGAGAGTIAIDRAMPHAVSNNDPIRVYRNQYGWPTGGAHVLRMQGLGTANAFTSDAFVVPLRGAVPRTMWCRMTGTLWAPVETTGIGTLPVSVTLDVVDTVSGLTIGTVAQAVAVPVQSDPRPAPVTFTLTTPPINLLASKSLKFVVTSPATADASPFLGLYVTEFAAFVSTDSATPLIDGSHANALWHAGNQYLLGNDALVPALGFTFVELATPHFTPETIQLGQSAFCADFASTQRVVRIERNHRTPSLSNVSMARLARPAERLLAGTSGAASVSAGAYSSGTTSTLSTTTPSTTDGILYFDIRAYGAIGEYFSPAFTSKNNTAAIQATIAACQAAGGGTVFIPAGKFRTDDLRVSEVGVHIRGAGKRASYLIYEPSAAGTLLTFSSIPTGDASGTTLGPCSVRDVSLWGAPIDYSPAISRHQKTAIKVVCVSGFLAVDVDINDWHTTSDNIAEGLSIPFDWQGKEVSTIERLSFGCDDGIQINQNPKERGTHIIDCDLLHIIDLYGVLNDAGGALVRFNGNLNVPSFRMSGENIVGGGKDSVIWDDASGTYDCPSFVIDGLRSEQQNDPTGCSVMVSRKGSGRCYNLVLRNLNLNFASRGIEIEGCLVTSIKNVEFLRFTSQSTSPLALKITGYTYQTVIENFLIPVVGGGTTLFDVTGQAVSFTSGGSYLSQLPPMVVYN